MRSGLLLVSMMVVGTPALAVYKCETDSGTLYTDIPCSARQLELPPPPPASDPASARRRAQNDSKQLAAIEKEEERARNDRRRQEAGTQKTTAAINKRCTQLGLEKKWSAEDAALASRQVSERSETLKRQARRKAERFDAECQGK